MSIIALGAKSYLSRDALWKDADAQSRLRGVSNEQLKLLLRMAIAEGQSQVEQWVRTEMSSRGIYASHRLGHKVVESKMDARDWLEKALAVILVGGMMFGGALPVVDNSAPPSAPAAVTQIYQPQEFSDIYRQAPPVVQAPSIPREISQLVDSLGMKIQWVRSFDNAFQGGQATGQGVVIIKTHDGRGVERRQESIVKTILHEVAHELTHGHKHDQTWCDSYFDLLAQYTDAQTLQQEMTRQNWVNECTMR